MSIEEEEEKSTAERVLGVETGTGEGQDDENKWSDQRPRKPTEQLIAYVKSVGGSLDSALEDVEREALVRNVLEEIHGHEGSLACSRATCFVLESFLRQASLPQLTLALDNMKRYFGFLCSNRQGSHVVQTVFTQLFERFSSRKPLSSNNDESDIEESEREEEERDEMKTKKDDADAKEKARELLCDLCKTIIQKEIWGDLIFDAASTHPIRALMCLLAGVDPQVLKRKRAIDSELIGRKSSGNSFHPEFSASLHAFLVALSKWPSDDVKQACTDQYSSPVVQLLLAACSSKHKAWKALFDSILKDSENANAFDLYCKDRIGSHVIEILVSNCDDETFDSVILQTHVKGRMLKLCEDPTANFVLQYVLASLRTPEQCKSAVEELEEEVSTSLLKKKLGVVLRWCQAAKKCDNATQSKVCRAVLRGIRASMESKRETSAPIGTIERLLELRITNVPPQEEASNEDATGQQAADKEDDFQKVNVSILGARLAGALFELSPESCRAALESVASMSPTSLKLCCLDPVASKHMMEPLMSLPLAGGWAKQRVLQKLKDDIVVLATHKFGHHVIKKAFDAGANKDKLLIIKAFSKRERRLMGSKFGKQLATHCKLFLFKKEPQMWEGAVKHGHEKKRKVAAESLLRDLEEAERRGKAKKKARKQ